MRVLYSSEADTIMWCSGWASSANQRRIPLWSIVEHFELITRCVCRSGSLARESRCVNAVAIRPSVLTWATPLVPVRVSATEFSRKATTSATAS
ncbi:Uncharacterised protein [Mycobacteroides abscessus subsp. abscessus]|nr:Uncharacterised protein [Mycobacteroides abscessus subsp. abscessus]SHS78069.1 Uncharacterised protein [Mycobacteroides abscessus subsp. abscessus]SHS89016.1 Uncharacterised protein [Mycobacteroides abscessus subsp. abscessus]SHV73974.1 Uncharacterised protein [Mycobacteroides abscessus subsp. abscessus]SIL87486.1 Uncharacterised protein [Mycobacteroides abscessus subsp. abscessus]